MRLSDWSVIVCCSTVERMPRCGWMLMDGKDEM